MAKRAEILCEYQNYIDAAPQSPQQLYGQAASSDQATVSHWRDTWIKNTAANHARFGSFGDRTVGHLWGKHKFLPVIVVGSGPSLKENAAGLLNNPGIPVVSCLHNFHYLEDLGVKVDYYVSLDAGPVTIEEVSEGGKRTPEEYWALTKDKTLVAYIGSDPKLLELWQGQIYFFNCPVPDEVVRVETDKIEPFHTFLSTGGNVLGAAVYLAKAILGAAEIVFMGANFAFSYAEKFHGWDSKYDKDLGRYVRATDVYGNSVKSWQSYANFKAWFDWLCQTVPGSWVNCTEGGTLGAYPGGNIRAIRQMDLVDYFKEKTVCNEVKEQCLNPKTNEHKILF